MHYTWSTLSTLVCRKQSHSYKSRKKNSKSTAKCFRHWFRTGGAIAFNHYPSKLNFAFKGYLSIIIPDTDGHEETVMFDEMVLAQGHKGGSNNWWFGGVNCTARSNHRIECPPFNSLAYQPHFCFHRASDDVNKIYIVSCTRTY